MKKLLALTLIPGLLLAGIALADDGKLKLSPSQLQDNNSAAERAQLRLEQQAGGEALQEKRHQLVSQCWDMLRKQSRIEGPVRFESVSIIEEARVYINGRVSLPIADGKRETRHYECRLDEDRKVVETASLNGVVAE